MKVTYVWWYDATLPTKDKKHREYVQDIDEAKEILMDYLKQTGMTIENSYSLCGIHSC